MQSLLSSNPQPGLLLSSLKAAKTSSSLPTPHKHKLTCFACMFCLTLPWPLYQTGKKGHFQNFLPKVLDWGASEKGVGCGGETAAPLIKMFFTPDLQGGCIWERGLDERGLCWLILYYSLLHAYISWGLLFNSNDHRIILILCNIQ